MGQQYKTMSVEEDVIGWRRFMEGMMSKKLVGLQVLEPSKMGTYIKYPYRGIHGSSTPVTSPQ